MLSLIELVRRLRDPETGCPWDRQQTLATYARYLSDEAAEVAEAVERGDPANLREEIGDVLFCAAFLSELAREAGHFTLDEAIDGAVEKLVRRHPHVFGTAKASTPEEALAHFQAAKALERS